MGLPYHAKASNGTINRELALLRRMFRLAVYDGVLRVALHFPMLRESAPGKGFFEHGDFQKLRQVLPEYLRPLTTVGDYTGMRLGEILKIQWSSVDLVAGEIRLNPDFVFVRGGKRIASFYKAWRSACDRANLPGSIFHDLRRTGVRNLVRAGVPERVAIAISGHKTQAVFKLYNIVSGRNLKEAAAKLESYLGREEKGRNSCAQGKGDNSGTIADAPAQAQKSLPVN